jgi:2-oxoglutarate/2-oxoacid ferredoxin oxidoreductase subunit alpha
MKDILIRIGGEGGEGVISCGEMLTTALARSSHEVFTFRTYPAEVKGGPAMFQVRASDEPVLWQGQWADILVTFNEEAFQLHGKTLKPDGLLVYDPAHYQPKGSFEAYAVPLEEMTMRIVKSKLGKNMVALGVIARVFGLPVTLLEQLVKDKFGKKGEAVIGKNLEALRAGYEYVDQHPFRKNLPKFEPVPVAVKRVVMSGNEALCVGAIAAGCRYYAGYPITPRLRDFGIHGQRLAEVRGSRRPNGGRNCGNFVGGRGFLCREEGDDRHLGPGLLADG